MRPITSLRNRPGRLAGLLVHPASAHCDTADGPAVGEMGQVKRLNSVGVNPVSALKARLKGPSD